MLAWRLLLATGEPRFADLIERTLYNVVATSPAPDGRAFFYANPLHQRVPGKLPDPEVESRRASSSLREPWFLVACCPTNVARTLASLAAYLATADGDGIQIHQYVESHIRTTLDDGRRVGLEVTTDYPRDGAVTVRITESDQRPWALTLRVPDWARDAEVTDPSGTRRPAGSGTVVVEWPFAVGDEVTLAVPVVPRVDDARPADRRHPRVRRVRARSGRDVRRIGRPPGRSSRRCAPRRSRRCRHGTTTARSWWPPAWSIRRSSRGRTVRARGVDSDEASQDAIELTLTPYHSWANRGPSTMRVWIPATTTT